jgi:hypothetical protein
VVAPFRLTASRTLSVPFGLSRHNSFVRFRYGQPPS